MTQACHMDRRAPRADFHVVFTASEDAGDMTQNDDLSGALIYFGGVFAFIISVIALALFLRRKDRCRVTKIVEQLGLRQVDATDGVADPRLAKLVSGEALEFGDTIDLLGLVGTTSVITRRNVATTMKVTSAYVAPTQLIQRPGIVALVRGTTTTKSTGLAACESSTTGTDMVVARLRRPVADHLHFVALTGAATPGVLKRLEGPMIEAMQATGQRGEMLADSDLRYQFASRTDVDDVIAHDESLRSLLWAARRFPKAHTTAATQRYESMITPMHDQHLDEIRIFGDLLVLTAQSSPFKSGVRDRLIDMAHHFSASFH